MRARHGVAVLAAALSCLACGSRTGLTAPDAGPDAGTDAGPDAGPPPPPCIVAPPDAGLVTAELDIPASLAVVDIMFLVDATGSMRDEIDAVRDGLRDSVVPGVRRAIPDAAFGLAFFGEFPVLPHGRAGNLPYELRSPITTEVTRVEAAFDDTPNWGNLDDPEAAIEGLYQVATGDGYGAPDVPGHVPQTVGCPTGGSGGACFRDDALPIVMLITDSPMHNGPPGVEPEAPYLFSPAPHTYAQAVDAANALDLLVVTLGASDPVRRPPHDHLRALSRDTGSVDADGQPLWFDIGGGGDRIGQEIVSAVQFVASSVPLTVNAVLEDIPGDGIDAELVIRGVRARSADPSENVEAIEGDTFRNVVPGTRLTFEVQVDASELPPSTERRVFPARMVFRASGRSRLDVREIEIVVPGADGLGCPDEL